MTNVEVFGEGEDPPLLFVGKFAFLPRIGDYISKDADGYFDYLHVVEVWHREVENTGNFQACVSVQPRD